MKKSVSLYSMAWYALFSYDDYYCGVGLGYDSTPGDESCIVKIIKSNIFEMLHCIKRDTVGNFFFPVKQMMFYFTLTTRP
jgi:hypothetical protein